ENNVPLATFSNVGRSSQATHYYMAGESQPGAGALNMTLWANGGSVLDPASGISVRAADGRVEARPGAGGAWQTIDSFGSLFAPAGDFMSFLVAATDIRVQTAANGLLSYSFTIDGPRFAEFMRQQLQTQMIASGELLPGMTLQTPAIYAGMTGSGVLWLDAAGLPSRQEIHLTLPAEASRQADTRLTVDSVVTFTDYSFAPQRAGVGAWLRSLPAARLFGAGRLADIGAVILPASLFLVAIAWLARLLWRSRPTVAYRFFAILLVTIMLLTPLFQGAQIARAATLRLLRQESRAAQQEDSAMQRALADWREEAAASTIPAGALDRIRADDGTDSDGDGLSDVVEWLQDEGTLAQEEGWAELLLDLGCVTIVDDGYTTDDADGDGLTDYEECLLGTSSATSTLRDGLTPDGRDSDGDSLPDLWEVTGYAYAGEHWYPDPLAADSNFDALPDTLEWEVDANGDGEADDSDGDGIPDMRDTDLDGIPDLFDRDNDGDGVPDRLDSSPFTASARPLYDSAGQLTGYDGRLFDDSNPLALQLNDLSSDKLTFVEFQLRPTDPDHLWYARNVLDWPQYDRRGQMQDDDNLTFLDIAEPGRAAANDGNGDIRLVPMLEIYIPGPASGLPDNALLDQYGISIQPAEAGVYAYVPVYVVADDAGAANVAFFAKMLYLPGAGWAAAHEINLVWMVQALVDRCASYEYVDSEGETQQSSDCQSYSAHNEVEVIHVYENDPWYLTGLNVREEHGVDFAIIYEDPAVDTDVNDDEALIQLAQGFDYSLLIGRDCGTGDSCVADGQRDISVATIYDRWNRTTNGAVSDDERWGIDNILRVQSASFGNIDEALATIAMTTTVALLNSNFGVPPTTAITPTLLFAREERYRAASLDNLGTALFWTGSHLDVNMDPARVTLDVLAGVNWAMYTQGDDGWASLAADAVWDELARRYDGAFGNEEQAVAEGMLVGVQLFYSSLLVGVNRIVETDGRLLPAAPSLYLPDKPLAASVLKGVGSAANLIVARFLLAGLDAIKPAAYNTFFRYLRDVFFHTFFETVASPLSGLMVKINKLTKLTGWKLGVGTGAIIAGTLLIVGLAVGLAFALGDDDVGRAVLAGVVGLVLAAVMLVGPINELAAALKGTDGIAKTLSRLGGLTRLSTASRAAGAIGLIISIGVPIGVFIYQWVEGGLTAGSPEFNYLLAYTIAAVALAILLFVLSLTIVGAIIVALLAIVDIILLIAGVDFSVTTWLTEKLTDNYYTYNQIFDSDINLGSLDMSLDNPERG
ncbi:MAG: thrombospondin type 3 repeat-containing protein, partial [Anaerolineales bacterium]|nr:thrombospondin type 3 repeat-containing protein [Anaerolineales bacterium]